MEPLFKNNKYCLLLIHFSIFSNKRYRKIYHPRVKTGNLQPVSNMRGMVVIITLLSLRKKRKEPMNETSEGIFCPFSIWQKQFPVSTVAYLNFLQPGSLNFT